MSQDVSVLRTQIQQFLQTRPSIHHRFPSELKATILEHARSRRSREVSLEFIAADLGLSFNTLRGWMYSKPAKATLKPVVVSSSAQPRASVVLVTRHGHRVEGLDIDGMAALLRGLS